MTTRYTKDHEYLRIEGDTATVGITDYAQEALGDVVFGIDGMYRHANRGEGIGGWKVTRFTPGVAVLEKTTPHFCALEEGILYEALHIVGAESLIVQSKCRSRGDALCEFELRSSVRDARWMGVHHPV